MLHCGRFTYSLSRPLLMGIINVTPDSFSDGGLCYDAQQAITYGLRLIDEGADILDIGGESTRPGAARVSEQEELARVLPVLEGLVQCGVALSIAETRRDARCTCRWRGYGERYSRLTAAWGTRGLSRFKRSGMFDA